MRSELKAWGRKILSSPEIPEEWWWLATLISQGETEVSWEEQSGSADSNRLMTDSGNGGQSMNLEQQMQNLDEQSQQSG